MTVDAIIKELNATGWIILSLHQYSALLWGCKLCKKKNVHGKEDFYIEVCDGKTILDALQAALFNSRQARNNPKAAIRSGALTIQPAMKPEQHTQMREGFEKMDRALREYQIARCPVPKP